MTRSLLPTYLKLWLKPNNGRKRPYTVLLQLIAETPLFYHGRKVNCYGEDNSYERRGVLVDVQELIDKALVVKTKVLEMDKKYGMLTESLDLDGKDGKQP